MRTLEATIETWPVDGVFTISRGPRREAVVVVATIRDGDLVGRGEGVPYARYGETPEEVLASVRSMAGAVNRGELDRRGLLAALPAGAARNALDCALWDLECKRARRSAAELAGFASWHPLFTAMTISLAEPERMAEKAAALSAYPLLKLKLGGDGDDARMRAVRAARPDARLIADANEAWREDRLEPYLAVAREVGVELIEQPLPAERDAILRDLPHPVPICADESVHTHLDVSRLVWRYDVVNVKLDKAGGLTEALRVVEVARANGLQVMVGCMLGTSLAMAPAHLLAQNAEWVDLDGPLHLARDREPGLIYEGAKVAPPSPELWGGSAPAA